MSSELDRFVLQYQVDLKDSISRLEKLNEKMRQVEKTGATSQTGFSKMADSIRKTKGEITSTGSSFNSLFSNLGKVSPMVAGAGAAFLGMASAMKIASSTARELNQQLEVGRRSGMAPIAVEAFQRNISSASRGQIRGAQAQSMLERTGALIQGAYADPMQTSAQARMLRMAGVNINGPRGVISADEALSQMAVKLSKSREEESIALGRLLGFQDTEIKALRTLGGEVSKMNSMTEGEAKAYLAASQAAQQFDASIGSMAENVRELAQDIGSHLLPALAGMADWISGIAKSAKRQIDEGDIRKQALGQLTREQRLIMQDAFNATEVSGMSLQQRFNTPEKMSEYESAKKAFDDSLSKLKGGLTSETKSAMDKVAEQQKQIFGQQGDLARSINLFSQATSQFAHGVSDAEAMAAWAGEMGAARGGKQAGMGGGSATFNAAGYGTVYGASGAGISGAGTQGRNISTYDAMIVAAANNRGIDPALLKKVISAASNFNPNAVSPAGAIGLGQIMPSTAKNLGFSREQLFRPEVSIGLAATILAQNKKKFGTDERALLAYNGGWDPSKWGKSKENAQYVGRVMSQNVTLGGSMNLSPAQADAINATAAPFWNFKGNRAANDAGFGRRNIRDLQTARTLAAASGGTIPAEQIMQGKISRGDVQFLADIAMTSAANSRMALAQQANVPGLNSLQLQDARLKLQQADMAVAALSENVGGFVNGAPAGPRDLTLGMQRGGFAGDQHVEININGAQDPHAIAREVENALKTQNLKVVNGMSYPLNN